MISFSSGLYYPCLCVSVMIEKYLIYLIFVAGGGNFFLTILEFP